MSRSSSTDWPVKGDNVVEGVAYVEEGGRVSINKTQYFGGVPKVVWGIPHRRLSGMPKMAQGPQGPETAATMTPSTTRRSSLR